LNKQIRVLIADDEESFALNLKRLLEARGFQISIVFDGLQAVETIYTGPEFDIVVLDVKMPGMDGISALEKIKAFAPDIEVIMLTGHATLSSGIQAIRKGAFDYLMKPCDIEDVSDKIREAYDVEKIKRHPILWPRKTVEEIMSLSFPTLSPDDSLHRALEAFTSETVDKTEEVLFIMDQDQKIIGFITKRSLIDEAEKHLSGISISWSNICEKPEWLPNKTVKEIMLRNHLTSFPDEPLKDIAQRMIKNNFRYVPVIDNGKTIGMVKMQQVLQYIEHETE